MFPSEDNINKKSAVAYIQDDEDSVIENTTKTEPIDSKNYTEIVNVETKRKQRTMTHCNGEKYQ